jgi:hypothetical protein
MPEFVILTHETPATAARPSHWDFMLEHEGALWTWCLQQSPDQAEPQPAERLPDHRAMYLDYEGPISGNRGSVTQWDRGSYEALTPFSETEVTVRLSGRKLVGLVTLTKTEQWLFQLVKE